MEPLIVLIVLFILTAIATRVIKKKWLFIGAGKTAMSVMLLFTAIGHFKYPDGMALMLPGFIPFKTGIIWITGFIEVAAAIGLQIPRFQKITAWLLVLFFVLILPANIYAAIHHVNLKTATFDGNGPDYLWFRVPLQLFFTGWIYYFGIRKAGVTK